jgi:predicted DsbA family dithiol-disulfide isomerase
VRQTSTIEVFADIGCPFTHVGLRRFVDRRRELGRDDVRLWVRSWPLEVVNGQPLDARFIDEEVEELRAQLGEELFVGFRVEAFPHTSLPAMAVAAAAYGQRLDQGERVSLELRDLLFERGVDIADDDVLCELAERHGLRVDPADHRQVLEDHAEGGRRGVIGSPHFFTPGGDFFCPSLDVHRDPDGQLQIEVAPEGFDRFLEACLA